MREKTGGREWRMERRKVIMGGKERKWEDRNGGKEYEGILRDSKGGKWWKREGN